MGTALKHILYFLTANSMFHKNKDSLVTDSRDRCQFSSKVCIIDNKKTKIQVDPS